MEKSYDIIINNHKVGFYDVEKSKISMLPSNILRIFNNQGNLIAIATIAVFSGKANLFIVKDETSHLVSLNDDAFLKNANQLAEFLIQNKYLPELLS